MNIYELKKYRKELFKEISTNNSITENDFIDFILDILLESKLIDNKSNNEAYINSFIEISGNKTHYKVNSYIRNETGERLQLFIVDDNGLFSNEDEFLQSTQEYYNNYFKLCENFFNFALKKRLSNIPDNGSINTLVNFIKSSEGINTIDAVDIFLISPTITYQKLGSGENLKLFEFKDSSVSIRYSLLKEGSQNTYDDFSKEIPIYKHLININYLYNNHLSTGVASKLIIDFEELNFPNIKAIEGVIEDKFESFISILPATLLTSLYQKYSYRLLEKNVRSFLQFKKDGPNSGMRKTLRDEPEKFIAYNNGLTITATEKEITNDGYLKSLTDFQIVNGGQTTASIYFSKKEGIDISRAYVTAKINIAKNSSEAELDDLITNISKNSNSQSKVTSVDLRSRNTQLGKVKILSESTLTPTGRKWFFEKSKGEFSTMLRMASNKNSIEKQYPKKRRISKEQLGKYYSSWGSQPHLIKKGGEAVFRIFIEQISDKEINKEFYEDMIGRVIFFQELEEIHGTHERAISQIRSAIIPYTISIIYEFTENSKGKDFNFFKIWKEERLNEKAKVYFNELMKLVLNTIKENAKSDDLSENSKKVELWKSVMSSASIKKYMSTQDSLNILNEYGISKVEKKNLLTKKSKINSINFEELIKTAYIYDKSHLFYKEILSNFGDILSDSEKFKINTILNSIKSIDTPLQEKISLKTINDYSIICEKIIQHDPERFDIIITKYTEDKFSRNLDWVMKKCNEAENKNINYYSLFKSYADLGNSKGIKYTSVFKEISDKLENAEPPTIKQLYYLNDFVDFFQLNKSS
jgi:hypothetical protein